jgi:hypothetical protein
MPHRAFTDVDGVPWQVWDVIPQDAERARGRRNGVERRGQDVLLYKGPERRSGEDRRSADTRAAARRYTLTPGLELGWLVFESPAEKRRVKPIPPKWDTRSDAELERLCRAAPAARRVTGPT